MWGGHPGAALMNGCLLRSWRKLWGSRWNLVTCVTMKLSLLCAESSTGFLTPRPSLAAPSGSSVTAKTGQHRRRSPRNGPGSPYVNWKLGALIIAQVVVKDRRSRDD